MASRKYQRKSHLAERSIVRAGVGRHFGPQLSRSGLSSQWRCTSATEKQGKL